MHESDALVVTSKSLRIALGEYDTGWHTPSLSLDRAEQLVAAAASRGARLVVLPEMATTGFTMDTTRAVADDSPDIIRLGHIARSHSTWLIAGVALREGARGSEVAVNAALVIDPTGAIVSTYRKQHLFAFAGENDHYHPGDRTTIVAIDGVRIAPFICYELRFPELFRIAAREVDAMIVIANWPAARRAHWDALLAARAIENQCVVIGVNRVGTASGIAYDGGSKAFDAWGAPLLSDAGDPPIVTVDPAHGAAIRAQYPFLPDARLS